MLEYTKPEEKIVSVKYDKKMYPVNVEILVHYFDCWDDGTAIDRAAKLITGRRWLNLVKLYCYYTHDNAISTSKLTKLEMAETLEALDPLEKVWAHLDMMEGRVYCVSCGEYHKPEYSLFQIGGVAVCEWCEAGLADMSEDYVSRCDESMKLLSY